MRKCPRCQLGLFRAQVSEVNVMQCGKCQGNLIAPDRLNRIAATGNRTISDLMDDWRGYPPIDTQPKCRCPECHSMMEREKKRGGVKFDHFQCRDCNVLWLDPGEMEIYLLAYLVSDKGKEAQKFKDIHANMTDHEKAHLKKLIDALPEEIPDSGPYGGRYGDWPQF